MKTKITPEMIREQGLSPEEYQQILRLLGREPDCLELGIFAVMWSEHCSYKSSRIYLKQLPKKSAYVLQGPGENAGVIDLGEELALAFKIESHNHPSFIEPFQGAATGVGGILRDIFSMGARPLALLNSLRFGEINHPRTAYLLDGVVRGISAYGNCVGIPTVGGEVYFNSAYNGNILVNVFALGLLKRDRIFTALACGEGNPVIYAGAKTGRDGIHGATMASDNLAEETGDKRPAVQVGDPFTEKLLLESCLELAKEDYMVGIQDLGAGGLTCSSLEMAERGNSGMELDLSRIPCREEKMTPYEIMLSESQERMLIVGKKGFEKKIIEIFNKWDLEAVVIGKVIKEQSLKIKKGGKLLTELPIKPLTVEAPTVMRPLKKPKDQRKMQKVDLKRLKEPSDYQKTFLELLSSPNISNKSFIFEQYDHLVRTNTLILPGADAAVIRIKGTGKAVAISLDCNSLNCYLDPFQGAMCAVAEAARNLCCVGAKPAALTDCLNFANPERPEIMWQFKETIRGISRAASYLKTPVISGNVSFYNQNNSRGIYPTPVIGMVGILEDLTNLCTPWFKDQEDLIILLGGGETELGGSEYLNLIHNLPKGKPAPLNLKKEKGIQEAVLTGIEKKIIKSAHDLSEGGLLIALAEACISSENDLIGAEIELEEEKRRDLLLFGEAPSRIIISLAKDNLDKMEEIIKAKDIPAKIIGRVGGDKFQVNIASRLIVRANVVELSRRWRRKDKNLL